MRIARSLAVGVAAALSLSCALVAGLNASYTPAATDADVDSGDEASVGDGGAFCDALSPSPLFCCDFDTDGLAPLWVVKMTGGGVEALDFSEWKSPPASLRSATYLDGSDWERARVCTTFASLTSEFHLAFDVKVDGLGAIGPTSIASVRIFPGDYEIHVEVTIDHQGTWFLRQSWGNYVDGAASANQDSPLSSPPRSRWVRVRVDISRDLETGQGTVLVFYDDVAQGPAPVLVTPDVPDSGNIEVCLGEIAALPDDVGWLFYHDNVVFDSKPVH